MTAAPFPQEAPIVAYPRHGRFSQGAKDHSYPNSQTVVSNHYSGHRTVVPRLFWGFRGLLLLAIRYPQGGSCEGVRGPSSRFFVVYGRPLRTAGRPLHLSSSVLPRSFRYGRLYLQYRSFRSTVHARGSTGVYSISVIVVANSFRYRGVRGSGRVLPRVQVRVGTYIRYRRPSVFPHMARAVCVLYVCGLFSAVRVSAPGFSGRHLFLS